jgi:hypothetical protein
MQYISYLVRLGTVFIVASITFFLTACGQSNNVTFTTQMGTCPKAVNPQAPYCLSVTLTNNGNNQNVITSTAFPISELSMVVNSTVTNVQTPSTNSALDPNNCMGSTIVPGASCTFYLQLTGENYPVTSTENVDITLNYSLNNNLFGGGQSASTPFTVFEVTNLYILQSGTQGTSTGTTNVGLIGAYNSSGLTGSFTTAEVGDAPVSLAVDNKAYGYVYIGGASLGVYAYGNGDTVGSIVPSGDSGGISIGGASNLFTSSNLLYIAAMNAAGIYSYNLGTQTFDSTIAYRSGATYLNNTNAQSTVPVFYLVDGTNQVNACTNITSPSSCTPEAIVLDNINALGFLSLSSALGYTGLYAGTSDGLYLETIPTGGTAISPKNTWTKLTVSGGGVMSSISRIVTDVNNNLYAGDSSGNIWYVSSAATTSDPIVATQFSSSAASGSITAMAVDNFGSVLYVTTDNNLLYSCSISTVTANSCTLAAPPNSNGGILPTPANPVVGMVIGSQLLSSSP